MKLTKYAIVFTIVFLALFTIVSVKTSSLSLVTKMNIDYNRKLDNAAFDAVWNLVEYDSTGDVLINHDEVLHQFHKSLYANFGVTDSQDKQEQLKKYIPVILITELDGFRVYYTDTYIDNGTSYYINRWSEKIPYAITNDDGYVYQYYLGQKKEFVKLYNMDTNMLYEGNASDVAKECDAKYLGAEFDTVRRTSIIDSIQKAMEYYINMYNKIAKDYGLEYTFYLPSIDENPWIRTVDDISFLFLFQGYPYGNNIEGYYNRCVFSGARIKKSASYYIEERDGELYYHRSDCKILNDRSRGYVTREECALLGARPCEECKP